jgi:hypothetical protein
LGSEDLGGFLEKLTDYLSNREHGIAPEILINLINSGKLGARISKRLGVLQPILQMKAIPTQGLPLTASLLNTLLIAARTIEVAERRTTSSSLLSALSTYQTQIAFLADDQLNQDAITTLSVIIDDYQRDTTNTPNETDKHLITSLTNTQTITVLRPKTTTNTGNTYEPQDYLTHFNIIEQAFLETKNHLSADAARKMQNSILPGLKHIITHENAIIDHVTTRYGVLYELAPDLPLHTDHNNSSEPEEYRKTLHRLMENCFGAFYLAKNAGKIPEFFSKLSSGFCLEGRIRDTLTWIADYSEIKSFDDVMAKAITEYIAYQKIMHGKAVFELGSLDEATEFIITRLNHFPCLPNDTYASKEEITKTGVETYLKDVLGYENEPMPATTEKDKFINQLDQHIKHQRHFLLFTSNKLKRTALTSLRTAIVYSNNDENLHTVVNRWKQLTNPATGKTNQMLISQHRHRFFEWLPASMREEKTATEKLLALTAPEQR